ncbi:MAG: hypothetical protein QGG36_21240 [Pirellulaceae bacterium]|jgi:hypothetical protein|nr:hypothetical protein [Pirellulaceae bacterium]MDP7018345.1 hypothetical protein [Pirellulaceae bacterium]
MHTTELNATPDSELNATELNATATTFEETVQARVKLALNSSPGRSASERRRSRRHPYPYPVQLTPVTSDGEVLTGDTFFVLGKHLGEGGLDFYHSDPVPYRRAIASLKCGDQWVSLLMDLTWCRFGVHSWYENGGRFINAVLSPLDPDAPTDLRALMV